MSVANPVKMVEAFGINAGPAYITAPFPVASQISTAPGNASLNDGFTPLNMTPITEGGIPPSGADMNGILFLISSNVAALSAGQILNVFDSVYATAIGGYNAGAQVLDATSALRRWTSFIAANTTDPATTPANWVSSTPILSTSAPTAGTHADNVLAGPSDFFLDVSTAAGAITLNGFIAQRDGQKLVISNTGANALNIGALAGAAGNQVRLSSTITLLQNDSMTIQYCKALASGVGQWVQV
jgi:hypothetical protein